jgi:hypothetical protein
MTTNDNWALRHPAGAAIILLVAASIVLTLGFACALPLAAFAAISAVLFKRGAAMIALLSVWLANQVVGFSCLHYPADFSTIAWGAALGGIALISLLAARAVLTRSQGFVALALGFAAAFAAYEGSIYAASLASGANVSHFTFDGVTRILLINAAAFGCFAAFRALWLRTAFGRNFEASLAPHYA